MVKINGGYQVGLYRRYKQKAVMDNFSPYRSYVYQLDKGKVN